MIYQNKVIVLIYRLKSVFWL